MLYNLLVGLLFDFSFDLLLDISFDLLLDLLLDLLFDFLFSVSFGWAASMGDSKTDPFVGPFIWPFVKMGVIFVWPFVCLPSPQLARPPQSVPLFLPHLSDESAADLDAMEVQFSRPGQPLPKYPLNYSGVPLWFWQQSLAQSFCSPSKNTMKLPRWRGGDKDASWST